MKKKISVIFGTRPEAIKLAPVILYLKNDERFHTHMCITAQHRLLLDQVLDVFGLLPDVDLNLMKHDQSLIDITTNAMATLDRYLKLEKPDMVLVQGDTTTVMAAALASFYNKIPVGHIEAGLRTHNKYSPYPEEINRVLTTHIADLHFAPTETAKNNLMRENVKQDKIFVTGNTVIDALLMAQKMIAKDSPEIPGISEEILNGNNPIILITGHRRENLGLGFESICNAILKLANIFPDHRFIYPVHLNPNVQKQVKHLLGGVKNIYLIEPLQYLPFVRLMSRTKLIITDSGGIQEEAPSLGIPVLIMRGTTERPEGIESGSVKLVGTKEDDIISSVKELLINNIEYRNMLIKSNPYGDGNASQKIIRHIVDYFS